MTPELDMKLREVRWFPGRRVDDAQVVQWLKMGVQDFGCHVFPEVVKVLREYGDLVFGRFHISPEGSSMRRDKLE